MLLPVLVHAGEGAAHAASAAEARSWLQRIHSAASQRNYQGTLVVSAGGSMSSSRLAHYCEGNQFFERIEVLDGQARRVYRHNDQVLTLWPVAKIARAEQRDGVALFPAVLSGSADQLFDRYDMVPEGADRVAGYGADVICCARAMATDLRSACGLNRAAACCCVPMCWQRTAGCWKRQPSLT